ncbi:MAG: hypothetical protein ABI821_11870 [Pseudomonadota bacterium]
MTEREHEIELLARRRVRTALYMVCAFVVVLAAIAANDLLVREGMAFSPIRTAVLAILAGGAIVLVMNLARFLSITRRSLREPALRMKLWDELAHSNHIHSMVFAFGAMLLVLITLAVASMFATLSAPWVVNGLLVTGFGVQAGAFAVLERKGEDARA